MNTDGGNWFSRKKAHKAQKVEIKGEIGAGRWALEAGRLMLGVRARDRARARILAGGDTRATGSIF
jgi:hypothetical protein